MQSITCAAVHAAVKQGEVTAGCWPVMLTPFDTTKRIDWDAYAQLIDWYISAGSQGLFAACLSSEIFQLTPTERVDLARHAVSRAEGRVPVIAAGALGNTPWEIADAANRLANTGIEAVILLSNQFAEEEESDDIWLANANAALERIRPEIKLGIYEAPLPYKRVLSLRIARWAAESRRFYFTKDTCCDLVQIKAKLGALAGTPLRFYNAHTATLLPSLLAGGSGFSGVGANAVPHFYAWLCRYFHEQPELAAELQEFLIKSSNAIDHYYPHSAKAWMQLNGLPVRPDSRVFENNLTDMHMKRLHRYQSQVVCWEERLNIHSPFPRVHSV